MGRVPILASEESYDPHRRVSKLRLSCDGQEGRRGGELRPASKGVEISGCRRVGKSSWKRRATTRIEGCRNVVESRTLLHLILEESYDPHRRVSKLEHPKRTWSQFGQEESYDPHRRVSKSVAAEPCGDLKLGRRATTRIEGCRNFPGWVIHPTPRGRRATTRIEGCRNSNGTSSSRTGSCEESYDPHRRVSKYRVAYPSTFNSLRGELRPASKGVEIQVVQADALGQAEEESYDPHRRVSKSHGLVEHRAIRPGGELRPASKGVEIKLLFLCEVNLTKRRATTRIEGCRNTAALWYR